MKTRIQKWGNSLSLRIPKAFAAEVGIDEESPVELTVLDGKLVISPAVQAELTLDELLAGITEDNLHGEADTGPAVGDEVW